MIISRKLSKKYKLQKVNKLTRKLLWSSKFRSHLKHTSIKAWRLSLWPRTNKELRRPMPSDMSTTHKKILRLTDWDLRNDYNHLNKLIKIFDFSVSFQSFKSGDNTGKRFVWGFCYFLFLNCFYFSEGSLRVDFKSWKNHFMKLNYMITSTTSW